MRTHTDPPVAIRDRRELPLFQVRLDAVNAIRGQVGGPRRLRAIGFYALLCQLANEQRHVGEHRVVQVSYETLADRAGASKTTVKQLLDTLARASVVRYERVCDPDRGATIGRVHILVQDGAWTAITVAMADHLARERRGGHVLRDLGLIVVLLVLCAEQRAARGGLSAEATRGEIAARAGLTVGGLDDCHDALERAGVLAIDRRRAANGGRHLPNTYTIHEAPPTQDEQPPRAERSTSTRRAQNEYRQGAEPVPAGRRTSTGRAADEYRQGGEPVPAGPHTGTGRAEHEYLQGGNSATLGTGSRPSIARAGEHAVENDIETPPHRSAVDGGGEGVGQAARLELCEALLAAWEPALGDSPRRGFDADRAGWLAAAGELLGRHPRGRLQHALDYMVSDEILGSRALSLPELAKVADQLLARHHARRRRSSPPSAAATGGGELGWSQARELLERAVQRHGRDNRAAAIGELSARSALFVGFVERVRWSVLCEQPMRYGEPRYAQLWAELLQDSGSTDREVAA